MPVLKEVVKEVVVEKTLEISVSGDALQFNKDKLTATSGSEVVLVFHNVSIINQHNWVLVQPGTKDGVAAAGAIAGAASDWIPAGDQRIFAHTGLLDPGQTKQVRFTAPAPGTYQFVCTFPGHNFTEFGDFEIISAPRSSTGFAADQDQLASKFAPVLWMHPDDPYLPKAVSIMVDHAEVTNAATGEVVLNLRDLPKEQRLDRLGVLEGSGLYLDFRQYSLTDGPGQYADAYNNVLANRFQTTVYAQVHQQEGKTIVQYWFFYLFNDWFNIHEGDWEMVQIVFNTVDWQELLNTATPATITYSQHGKPALYDWSGVAPVANHPPIYVARGSHASYPGPGEFGVALPWLDVPQPTDVTSADGTVLAPSDQHLLDNLRRVATGNVQEYELVLAEDAAWLSFPGNWGERSSVPHRSGPTAPAYQEAWQDPLGWQRGG